MKTSELATWFDSPQEVIQYFNDLRVLIQGKKLIWMRVVDKEGSIELHFENLVVTVKVEHISFLKRVK